MVIDEVRDRATSNRRKRQSDNFIKKNMYLIKYWNEYDYERRKKHHDSLQTNLETCLRRREIILKYKRERQDTIKRLKEQIREEARRRKKLTNRIAAWNMLMTQHKAAQTAIVKFQKYVFIYFQFCNKNIQTARCKSCGRSESR